MKNIITSQYQATLAMLEQTLAKCPDSLWDSPDLTNRFWHVAYHALFYTHLYSQISESDFKPWAKHRADYQFLGPTPWPPHAKPEIGEPYSQADILDYLAFCQRSIKDWVDALDLEGESGFEWLPMNKLELQFYTIRHLQQHVGELSTQLMEHAGIEIDWVGMKPQS